MLGEFSLRYICSLTRGERESVREAEIDSEREKGERLREGF